MPPKGSKKPNPGGDVVKDPPAKKNAKAKKQDVDPPESDMDEPPTKKSSKNKEVGKKKKADPPDSDEEVDPPTKKKTSKATGKKKVNTTDSDVEMEDEEPSSDKDGNPPPTSPDPGEKSSPPPPSTGRFSKFRTLKKTAQSTAVVNECVLFYSEFQRVQAKKANPPSSDDVDDFVNCLLNENRYFAKDARFYTWAAQIFPTLRGETDEELNLEVVQVKDVLERVKSLIPAHSRVEGILSDKYEVALVKKFANDMTSLFIQRTTEMDKDLRTAMVSAFHHLYHIMTWDFPSHVSGYIAGLSPTSKAMAIGGGAHAGDLSGLTLPGAALGGGKSGQGKQDGDGGKKPGGTAGKSGESEESEEESEGEGEGDEFDQMAKAPKRAETQTGLAQLGNTCYQAYALWALVDSKGVLKWIADTDMPDNQFGQTIFKIVPALAAGDLNKSLSLFKSMQQLLRPMKRFNGINFSRRKQQDPHEFISLVLQDLAVKPQKKDTNNTAPQEAITAALNFMLRQEWFCPCGYVSAEFPQPEWQLNVEVPQHVPEADLIELLLRKTTYFEQLEHRRQCGRCGKTGSLFFHSIGIDRMGRDLNELFVTLGLFTFVEGLGTMKVPTKTAIPTKPFPVPGLKRLVFVVFKGHHVGGTAHSGHYFGDRRKTPSETLTAEVITSEQADALDRFEFWDRYDDEEYTPNISDEESQRIGHSDAPVFSVVLRPLSDDDMAAIAAAQAEAMKGEFQETAIGLNRKEADAALQNALAVILGSVLQYFTAIVNTLPPLADGSQAGSHLSDDTQELAKTLLASARNASLDLSSRGSDYANALWQAIFDPNNIGAELAHVITAALDKYLAARIKQQRKNQEVDRPFPRARPRRPADEDVDMDFDEAGQASRLAYFENKARQKKEAEALKKAGSKDGQQKGDDAKAGAKDPNDKGKAGGAGGKAENAVIVDSTEKTGDAGGKVEGPVITTKKKTDDPNIQGKTGGAGGKHEHTVIVDSTEKTVITTKKKTDDSNIKGKADGTTSKHERPIIISSPNQKTGDPNANGKTGAGGKPEDAISISSKMDSSSSLIQSDPQPPPPDDPHQSKQPSPSPSPNKLDEDGWTTEDSDDDEDDDDDDMPRGDPRHNVTIVDRYNRQLFSGDSVDAQDLEHLKTHPGIEQHRSSVATWDGIAQQHSHRSAEGWFEFYRTSARRAYLHHFSMEADSEDDEVESPFGDTRPGRTQSGDPQTVRDPKRRKASSPAGSRPAQKILREDSYYPSSPPVPTHGQGGQGGQGVQGGPGVQGGHVDPMELDEPELPALPRNTLKLPGNVNSLNEPMSSLSIHGESEANQQPPPESPKLTRSVSQAALDAPDRRTRTMTGSGQPHSPHPDPGRGESQPAQPHGGESQPAQRQDGEPQPAQPHGGEQRQDGESQSGESQDEESDDQPTPRQQPRSGRGGSTRTLISRSGATATIGSLSNAVETANTTTGNRGLFVPSIDPYAPPGAGVFLGGPAPSPTRTGSLRSRRRGGLNRQGQLQLSMNRGDRERTGLVPPSPSTPRPSTPRTATPRATGAQIEEMFRANQPAQPPRPTQRGPVVPDSQSGGLTSEASGEASEEGSGEAGDEDDSGDPDDEDSSGREMTTSEANERFGPQAHRAQEKEDEADSDYEE
ncbi:hypothetical protein PRZ48_014570 [Zasmidium cellare]|uniref:USP domain-containing protein n=1 Tax=Zasmidium cellare TaxID=395010 RepID=A0ABR0DYP5_ZASCE|nr:hypothetical protein PRZ48_014570 [Zasmidium cellare]